MEWGKKPLPQNLERRHTKRTSKPRKIKCCSTGPRGGQKSGQGPEQRKALSETSHRGSVDRYSQG